MKLPVHGLHKVSKVSTRCHSRIVTGPIAVSPVSDGGCPAAGAASEDDDAWIDEALDEHEWTLDVF